MQINQYAVYIITNKANTVFYTGVTGELQIRILQHKRKEYKGFSARFNCNKLGYFELFQWIQDAIDREKQIKAGSRQKKIDLIVSVNSSWSDMSDGWYD
ncbi:GIY-YIG nuclease family protein [Mucilaginibacter mali]|uniref:GIY-YIG nuclease family protein n=1 Tax=Mucilaginibacter mali TaxID=2740462 RepID=A0A7D4UCV3_9SPHI|nr:GIY-YIG nuclease family protein [Mucilaginibacter mali]QKJ31998.1 GIY-YIG nuclease family protein [Mucilaginibacter mali]